MLYPINDSNHKLDLEYYLNRYWISFSRLLLLMRKNNKNPKNLTKIRLPHLTPTRNLHGTSADLAEERGFAQNLNPPPSQKKTLPVNGTLSYENIWKTMCDHVKNGLPHDSLHEKLFFPAYQLRSSLPPMIDHAFEEPFCSSLRSWGVFVGAHHELRALRSMFRACLFYGDPVVGFLRGSVTGEP